ncbi:hypothetical protein RvY_10100-1 [Ramazzottius varieornatus]|uniref:Uncharacterized protein n=1 Tax=Ramazzottius varieornatus TaxID=947166 RepID=A0A1D1VE34_RAMVA|nr:hypothetical protein RvY_10100-1 [Ramazzottius varieornatus]
MAYDGITGIFNASVDTITWIDGKSLPPNIPKCGFQNENLSCLVQNSDVATTVAAIVAVFVVMIICCITGFRFYQKRKFEQSLLDNWWQINRDDVKKRHEAKASTATLQAGSRPSVKAKSALFSASSQGSNEEAVFYTVGRYQGKMVHIREIHCPIEITRDFLVHMKRVRAFYINTVLRYDNDPLLATTNKACVSNSYTVWYTKISTNWSDYVRRPTTKPSTRCIAQSKAWEISSRTTRYLWTGRSNFLSC